MLNLFQLFTISERPSYSKINLTKNNCINLYFEGVGDFDDFHKQCAKEMNRSYPTLIFDAIESLN